VVAGSIVIHGIAATPVMSFLDHRRKQAARDELGDETRAATMPV
jgi:NhaP-type Na+/H+ or K+/H+ antiporter